MAGNFRSHLQNSHMSFRERWNSILDKYNQPFDDDDEIIWSSMEVIKYGKETVGGNDYLTKLFDDYDDEEDDDDEDDDDDDDDDDNGGGDGDEGGPSSEDNDSDRVIDLTVSPRHGKPPTHFQDLEIENSNFQDIPDDILCMDFDELKNASGFGYDNSLHKAIMQDLNDDADTNSLSWEDEVSFDHNESQNSYLQKSAVFEDDVDCDLYEDKTPDAGQKHVKFDIYTLEDRKSYAHKDGRHSDIPGTTPVIKSNSARDTDFNSTFYSERKNKNKVDHRSGRGYHFTARYHDSMQRHGNSSNERRQRHHSYEQIKERVKMATSLRKSIPKSEHSPKRLSSGGHNFRPLRENVNIMKTIQSNQRKPRSERKVVKSVPNGTGNISDSCSNNSGPVKRTPSARLHVENQKTQEYRMQRCLNWVLNMRADTGLDQREQVRLSTSKSFDSLKVEHNPSQDRRPKTHTGNKRRHHHVKSNQEIKYEQGSFGLIKGQVKTGKELVRDLKKFPSRDNILSNGRYNTVDHRVKTEKRVKLVKGMCSPSSGRKLHFVKQSNILQTFHPFEYSQSWEVNTALLSPGTPSGHTQGRSSNPNLVVRKTRVESGHRDRSISKDRPDASQIRRDLVSERYWSSSNKSKSVREITPKKCKKVVCERSPSSLLSPFKKVTINSPQQSGCGVLGVKVTHRDAEYVNQSVQVQRRYKELVPARKSLEDISVCRWNAQDNTNVHKSKYQNDMDSTDGSDGVCPLSDSDEESSQRWQPGRKDSMLHRQCVSTSSDSDDSDFSERRNIISESGNKQKYMYRKDPSSPKKRARKDTDHRSEKTPARHVKQLISSNDRLEYEDSLDTDSVDLFDSDSSDVFNFLTLPTPRRNRYVEPRNSNIN